MSDKSIPTSPKKSSQPDQYEVDNWANKVMDAHEIMGDPNKMKHVHPILAKKKAALRMIGKPHVSSRADLLARKAELDAEDRHEGKESKKKDKEDIGEIE